MCNAVPPTATSDKGSPVEQIYEALRGHIIHEDDLVNQRLTWLFQSQAFALAAIGVLLTILYSKDRLVSATALWFILSAISIVSLVVCNAIHASINAEQEFMLRLADYWRRLHQQKQTTSPAVSSKNKPCIIFPSYQAWSKWDDEELINNQTSTSVKADFYVPINGSFSGWSSLARLSLIPYWFKILHLFLLFVYLFLWNADRSVSSNSASSGQPNKFTNTQTHLVIDGGVLQVNLGDIATKLPGFVFTNVNIATNIVQIPPLPPGLRFSVDLGGVLSNVISGSLTNQLRTATEMDVHLSGQVTNSLLAQRPIALETQGNFTTTNTNQTSQSGGKQSRSGVNIGVFIGNKANSDQPVRHN